MSTDPAHVNAVVCKPSELGNHANRGATLTLRGVAKAH